MTIISFFKIREHNSNVARELSAGISTFMTMSYIIFVQPALLSKCGMDFGAVMVATCIASGIGCIIMGVFANYPIALAPAMGHNFYVVYTVCLGMSIPWTIALGINCVSGLFFLATTFFTFRDKLISCIPSSLKKAIGAGIGLLITLIGLEWSGLIVAHPGTLVTLGNLNSPPVILALFGIVLIAVLLAAGVRGAFLIGMLIIALAGIPFKLVTFNGVFSLPPSIAPTLFKLDIIHAFKFEYIAVMFVLFFLDLFDTVGTLVGVGEQGGFIVDGKLPRARQAFLADAIATVTGTTLGTTTVTSYIESSTGILQGGRTGLTSVVVGLLFFLSLFFYPLIKMFGSGVEYMPGVFYYPVTAPVLILIGSFMLTGLSKIDWNDKTESIPSFLTIMMMPLTFSITEGIAFGFIAYSVLKLATRRGHEVHWIVHLFSFLFLLRYILF